MKTNFELNDVEISNVKKFMRMHEECDTSAAIGGRFTYKFIPTSIGTIVIIKCNICKRKNDITDYSCW